MPGSLCPCCFEFTIAGALSTLFSVARIPFHYLFQIHTSVSLLFLFCRLHPIKSLSHYLPGGGENSNLFVSKGSWQRLRVNKQQKQMEALEWIGFVLVRRKPICYSFDFLMLLFRLLPEHALPARWDRDDSRRCYSAVEEVRIEKCNSFMTFKPILCRLWSLVRRLRYQLLPAHDKSSSLPSHLVGVSCPIVPTNNYIIMLNSLFSHLDTHKSFNFTSPLLFHPFLVAWTFFTDPLARSYSFFSLDFIIQLSLLCKWNTPRAQNDETIGGHKINIKLEQKASCIHIFRSSHKSRFGS